MFEKSQQLELRARSIGVQANARATHLLFLVVCKGRPRTTLVLEFNREGIRDGFQLLVPLVPFLQAAQLSTEVDLV